MIPYGTRGVSSRNSTFKTSPGRAPATPIGPETTCGPQAEVSRRACARAISTASRNTSPGETPCPPKKAIGSRP